MNPLTKTTYALMVLAIILAMCSCRFEHEPFKKPFVIIDKGSIFGEEQYFVFQDSSGRIEDFYDKIGKYNIGDTIK